MNQHKTITKKYNKFTKQHLGPINVRRASRAQCTMSLKAYQVEISLPSFIFVSLVIISLKDENGLSTSKHIIHAAFQKAKFSVFKFC